MPINILFLLSNFRAGGAERQYFNLIHGIDKKLFEIHVGLIQYRDSRASQVLLKSLEGVQLKLFERKHKADLSIVTEIAKYACENDIDIIQSLLFMDNQIARLAGLVSRKPVVTSIRGEILPLLGKSKSWFEHRMQILSKKIIVNSNWLKDYLVRCGSRPEKVVVIHNGIESGNFTSNADPLMLRRKYGIAENAKVIGIVARLHPMKDHVTFFDTVKLVRDSLPSVYAVVAGDGELSDTLKQYVTEIGLENNVTFLGNVTNELPEIYRMMNVFLLTSQWGESFPNVILEAMSASVPVVATNISAVPEIIEDGISGYLVEKKNAALIAERTLKILSNADIRSQFVRNGLKRAGVFTVEKMVKNYEQLYRSIINAH
jgi:glycosyltransferase involved in cell wall biosynthesis